MTPYIIHRKLTSYKKTIEDLEKKIEELQNQCNHEGSLKTYRGNTGNWDKQDLYWVEYECPTCKKKWSKDL